ncbi:MAG: type II secretion system F family protein [Comamonadaceae bacterium]|nr:type II secretion system F family protein [Comamonadaceae bacterium]
MPTYVWKGKNRYGDTVGGERVAASKEELGRMLQKDQITVLSIGAAKGGFSIPFLKREKVRMKDLAVYSRQLSVLIDAELPLIQSLGILEEQQKNTYFKNVIKTVKDDVEAGSTLNQAKRKHPKAFDDLYCNLIASGEQSGSLDIMLRRLSEFIEKNVKLRSKVKQAMIYPVGILIFAIVVTIFMLWKVIPVFATIFRDLGAELPWLTAMIVALSEFVQKYIFLIFAGLDRRLLRLPLLPEHQAGALVDRPAPPEDAPVRQSPLQGGHDPGHPDAGDPHLRRRAHARSHEDHLDDGRERHHREPAHRGPQARLRRQDHGRVLQAGRQVPDDDAPDDQRRRGHGHARRDAEQAGQLLRRGGRRHRGLPPLDPRAHHAHLRRRHRRRPGRLDVPADLQPDAAVLELKRGTREHEDGERGGKTERLPLQHLPPRRADLPPRLGHHHPAVLPRVPGQPALLLPHPRGLRLLRRLLRPLRRGPAARRPGLPPGRLRPAAHHRLRLHLRRPRLVDVLPVSLPDHRREPGHLRPGRIPGGVPVGHPLRRPGRRPLLRVHPRLPARSTRSSRRWARCWSRCSSPGASSSSSPR